MIARSVPISAPTITVANPAAEPSDAWIRAIAVMLLADAERERERDQDQEGDEEPVETWN